MRRLLLDVNVALNAAPQAAGCNFTVTRDPEGPGAETAACTLRLVKNQSSYWSRGAVETCMESGTTAATVLSGFHRAASVY